MPRVTVRRTFLEMTSLAQLNGGTVDDSAVRIERVEQCPAHFFRYLYAEVGRQWFWYERLSWTDDELRARLALHGLSLWVMTVAGAPAGYVELLADDDGSTEIAYFGVMPEFIGRGLGKHLLTFAVDCAWRNGACRVWLHTCTLDAPQALPNYLARGFLPFKEETYEAELPEE